MKKSMEKTIDCLFIGHNEMDFTEYEVEVRKMGVHSGAYRDLNLNFITYNGKPYAAPDIFNLFHPGAGGAAGDSRPLDLGETFSAAVAYLGTYLHRRGLTFDYVNSFHRQREELAEKLKNENIRTIGIITTLYVSVFPILEIMEFIKKYNRTARVVIGGPYISTQCRTMEPQALDYLFKSIGADFYVNSSQGEAALVSLIKALRDDSPLDEVPNIYYKPGETYTATAVSPENNPLDENMVDWGLFTQSLGEFVTVRTAISCPFSCAFCGFPQHAGTYRAAGVAAVEQELLLLDKPGAVKNVQFIDDTFNIPVKRFKELLRMMIRNKPRFKWYSHFRCQYADRETIELMKESGCIGVFLGIESGSDRILENMNKKVTVQKYREGIALLKEYDIMTYGSFIIGFPGETRETADETIRFIHDSGLDFYRAQLWYCEPITPIWQQREKYKISGESFEWSHATMDSNQASGIVEEIFLSVQQPIWVPQYNFECDGLFHLLQRGFTMDEVKEFTRSFNNAVGEKLRDPSLREIGFDALMRLKNACTGEKSICETAPVKKTAINQDDVEFDF